MDTKRAIMLRDAAMTIIRARGSGVIVDEHDGLCFHSYRDDDFQIRLIPAFAGASFPPCQLEIWRTMGGVKLLDCYWVPKGGFGVRGLRAGPWQATLIDLAAAERAGPLGRHQDSLRRGVSGTDRTARVASTATGLMGQTAVKP
jgi:hypothetical protein